MIGHDILSYFKNAQLYDFIARNISACLNTHVIRQPDRWADYVITHTIETKERLIKQRLA